MDAFIHVLLILILFFIIFKLLRHFAYLFYPNTSRYELRYTYSYLNIDFLPYYVTAYYLQTYTCMHDTFVFVNVIYLYECSYENTYYLVVNLEIWLLKHYNGG